MTVPDLLPAADVAPPASSMLDMRVAFCERLRAARERKRLTLAALAESTKIRASYFAALERGDLRSWPEGVYRRAYLVQYVEAIGLPVDETVEEFNRLFADDLGPVADADASPVLHPGALRLQFDSGLQRRSLVWSRIASAAVDLAAIAGLAGTAVLWAPELSWMAPAIVAAAYGVLSTACLGRSPATWLIASRSGRRRATGPLAGGSVASRSLRHLLDRWASAERTTGRRGPSSPAIDVNATSPARWSVAERARRGEPDVRIRAQLSGGAAGLPSSSG